MTTLGKILDPVGDKIAGAVIGVFCVFHRDLPLYAWLLATGRDLAMMIGGWIRYRSSGVMPVSINIGRYAALLWGIVLLLYTFDLQPYAQNALWPVMALYLLAGAVYWRKAVSPAMIRKEEVSR